MQRACCALAAVIAEAVDKAVYGCCAVVWMLFTSVVVGCGDLMHCMEWPLAGPLLAAEQPPQTTRLCRARVVHVSNTLKTRSQRRVGSCCVTAGMSLPLLIHEA
jgi:hypothetical protein